MKTLKCKREERADEVDPDEIDQHMLRHRLTRLAAAYDHCNTARPMLTKGLTCGGLLGSGDLLCQAIQNTERRDVDWFRAARMFSWGALCNGPAGHVWYAGLDRAIRFKGSFAIVLKIAADQLVFTPPLTFLYFIWQHTLTFPAQGPLAAFQFSADAVMPTLKVNWVYWSAVHVLTFTFVPLEYRVAFVAVKNFFWGGYLSYVGTAAEASADCGDNTLAAKPQAREIRRLARTATH